jgi:cupin fold WbuC family metalloprotein
MIDTISTLTFDLLCDQVRQSPRRRQHLNLHASHADPCQRFLNAISRECYIRPHRHGLDPKVECLIALRGTLGVIVFDDSGAVAKTIRLGVHDQGGDVGIQIRPELWHTVISLTDMAVLLEMKDGPFDPDAAKELAPWAPDEGGIDAASYLHMLHDQFEYVVREERQPSNLTVPVVS